jgi:predicted nucleic acid-binding Zn ribbon protein
MDCPNCGVYNPEERQVCWRCNEELPKPKPKKKREPIDMQRRMWIIIAVIIVIWLLITFVLPNLLGFGAPAP